LQQQYQQALVEKQFYSTASAMGTTHEGIAIQNQQVRQSIASVP
jgi:hypothetical protein